MILYHGSSVIVENPKIVRSEIGRDFGYAFYTTDIKEQAVRWAKRKAMIQERRSKKKTIPFVSCYEWKREKSYEFLRIKEFDGACMEWLDMVMRCRSEIDYCHSFDIVIGKIANDNVGETVSYVLQGIMRKEDAVKRLQFEKINNQIAFCTDTALEYLEYQGNFEG